MKLLTVTLRNGLVVLAKSYEGAPCAVTYTNHSQAHRKQQELSAQGVKCWVTGTRHPKYIVVDQEA